MSEMVIWPEGDDRCVTAELLSSALMNLFTSFYITPIEARKTTRERTECLLSILRAAHNSELSRPNADTLSAEPLIAPISLVSLADHAEIVGDRERESAALSDLAAAGCVAGEDATLKGVKALRTAEAAQEARC